MVVVSTPGALLHVLTLKPARISNYNHHKVWNEITYQFTNFIDAGVAVWEWINNFIPHFTGHAIAYPCRDKGYFVSVKVPHDSLLLSKIIYTNTGLHSWHILILHSTDYIHVKEFDQNLTLGVLNLEQKKYKSFMSVIECKVLSPVWDQFIITFWETLFLISNENWASSSMLSKTAHTTFAV